MIGSCETVRNSFLLDSNVLIWVLRGHPAVTELLHRLEDLEVGLKPATSVISVFEVLAGVLPGEEERTADLLTNTVIPVDVTPEVAMGAAEIVARQGRAGRALSVADALIAGTALTENRTLVTYDLSHFEGLGLTLYLDLPELE